MAEADADRNLLFGILALQMDFITRDALIAAMNAWVLDKAKPLGRILVDQGALADAHRALLEALVAEHLAHARRRPAAQPAPPSPARPGSARTSREVADPDVQASLSLRRRPTTRPCDDPYGDADLRRRAARPSAGARFRILRPHAKGGLGEVSVAHDEELNREVALKEIQADHADDPASRARFLLEAEITGGLEHPGIVPVYGLGHYADGRPFYAMRFIRGDSLKEAIERFHRRRGAGPRPGRARAGSCASCWGGSSTSATRWPTPTAAACCTATSSRATSCSASTARRWSSTGAWPRSSAATEAGRRTTRRRPLRPPSAGGSAATLAGSAVGTPAYMSPEQAAGQLDRLGPASDVYSLGATLYHLLTGRLALRRAATSADVLRKVERGEFPPPRAVHRAVPAALEAVCLKAMASGPRTATPRPRPWPTTSSAGWPTSRSRPGCEPFRAAGPALAPAASHLVDGRRGGGRGGPGPHSWRRSPCRAGPTGSCARPKCASRGRADRRRRGSHCALDAIRTLHTGASEDLLLKEPQFEAIRNKLLRTVLDFYRKLQEEMEPPGVTDPSARADLADSYVAVATITAATGSKDEALAAFERARALFSQLLRSDPHNTRHLIGLADALHRIGDVPERYRRIRSKPCGRMSKPERSV